jgi:hypothetical protein
MSSQQSANVLLFSENKGGTTMGRGCRGCRGSRSVNFQCLQVQYMVKAFIYIKARNFLTFAVQFAFPWYDL